MKNDFRDLISIVSNEIIFKFLESKLIFVAVLIDFN